MSSAVLGASGVKRRIKGEDYILASAPYSSTEADGHAEALRQAGNDVEIIRHKTPQGYTAHQVWIRAKRTHSRLATGHYASKRKRAGSKKPRLTR